ncbi:hypothetical protein SAMN05443247_04444 [Bradyrhizobium erythrophlei]|jgi:hypothetical protein|nr:hypothetical protein SAMN05443247_04444 [Bradyrhizobium erythrophlei]
MNWQGRRNAYLESCNIYSSDRNVYSAICNVYSTICNGYLECCNVFRVDLHRAKGRLSHCIVQVSYC